MKLFITCILLLFSFHARTPVANVYICDSKGSKAYHSSKTCRGIKICKHQVLEVTLKEATDVYKRIACKICY
ncbi:MAG: hypothetical protein JWP12_486 [Bacteroidetes bacterium]|nr:hypothetical protein [Bacteroidota bacterium]